jgi:hypothetical protein
VISGVTIDADAIDSAASAQAEADTILGFIGTPPDHEIVSISTITQGTNQLTVSILRGRLGSAPAAHEAGAPVYLIRKANLPIVTAPITEPSPVVDTATNPTGGTAYLFHLPQRVVLNVQNEDDCDDVSVSVAGDYSRPLPPESVTGATTYTGSDLEFTVTVPLWRDEGYSAADFYESEDLYRVPVLIYNDQRTVLSKCSKGSDTVTVTASEINNAIGTDTTGTLTIQFYSYVSGRHSRTGTEIMVSLFL